MTTLLKKQEVDHHVLKLIVGVIAIGLATITAAFSTTPIDSISASYHQGGWARDFLVGCLFAVSAFMLAYNGYSLREMVFSKIAAVAALGVALFPCGCNGHAELVPYLHYISAGVMFAVLAAFCALFRQRAMAKGTPQGRARALIYTACGLTIAATKRRYWSAAALGSSGLLYVAPILVITTGADFRYLWWLVVATLLGLFLYLCPPERIGIRTET